MYFFHIREGSTLIDDAEGIDLPDDLAAYDTALYGARSLLSAAVCEGRLPLDDAIVVKTVTAAVSLSSLTETRSTWARRLARKSIG